MAQRGLWGVLLFIGLMSEWTPLANARIAERWFTLPNLFHLLPVLVLTLVLAVDCFAA